MRAFAPLHEGLRFIRQMNVWRYGVDARDEPGQDAERAAPTMLARKGTSPAMTATSARKAPVR
jgi:hypothetical protein